MQCVTEQTFYLWRPGFRVQVSSPRAILSLYNMGKRLNRENKGNNASNWVGLQERQQPSHRGGGQGVGEEASKTLERGVAIKTSSVQESRENPRPNLWTPVLFFALIKALPSLGQHGQVFASHSSCALASLGKGRGSSWSGVCARNMVNLWLHTCFARKARHVAPWSSFSSVSPCSMWRGCSWCSESILFVSWPMIHVQVISPTPRQGTFNP